MDSITQAALGGLCGEIILSKKLGWRGILWGITFGTIPDLDVIAFAWLDAADQLRLHRGITHSLISIPIASLLFGWLLSKFHKERKLGFKRAFWFVAVTWGTHILIDCFNTYGTHILEPFSDYRYSLNNIFIIDLFFTVPIILALFICLYTALKKKQKLQLVTQWLVSIWLVLYVGASFTFKFMAHKHFANQFNEWGVTPQDTMSGPMPMNIFGWRGVARDDEKYYVTYWSLFDRKDRDYIISEFETGHHLEKDFKGVKEFETIKWFTRGWRKTYVKEDEPNTIYVAALSIGEVHSKQSDQQLFQPSFIWRIEKTDDGIKLSRGYKMTNNSIRKPQGAIKALANVLSRVKGDAPEWMKGTWIWDVEE